MHVRTSRKRRNGKTYEYAQLVESYRRDSDGLPVHRIIMSLAHLSPTELANLKTALVASRQGKTVVVAKAPRRSTGRLTKPTANLRYLDVAVLLQLWRQWQLDELFEDLLPTGDAAVAPSAIVCALTIQRCVDPGSKLYAERWFPKSALPELLGVSPEQFNNTRVHRVLDGLDQSGYELIAKLPRRYVAQQGRFAALFVDVTDTWFVGDGPKMAERAKTKEGQVRRKVGIVLLCNEHGLPLRWEVIRGKESDKASMARMIRSISALSWVGDAPVVCDRAMGNTAQIRQLRAAEVRFLTALVASEFGAYTDRVPHAPLAQLSVDVGISEQDKKRLIARAGQLAEKAGMTKVDDKLYVLDLGLIERPADSGATLESPQHEPHVDTTMQAVRLARQVRQAVADGKASSLAAAGRQLGLGKSVTIKYQQLANLSEQIQLAVVQGKARGVTITELLQLNKRYAGDLAAQDRAFEHLAQQAAAHAAKPRHRNNPPTLTTPTKDEPMRLRAVAYFNPEVFIDKRRTAQRHLADIDAFVDALNRRLASPYSKMTKDKILAEIYQKLRRDDLVEAYQVSVTQHREGRRSYRVQLTLKAETWVCRRRYDGFSLLVAHPQVKQSAIELCRLYRAKDRVEKDFETIKSFVMLRPVWHRVDAKVRAHVSVCMLSLLLERTLDRQLAGRATAQRALEDLADCHLNRYAGEQTCAYAITELNAQQDAILRALRLRHLADDDDVTDRITPR